MPFRPIFKLLPCRRISLLELCEQFIPDREMQKPFQRICALMRRADCRSICIHQHVEFEPYFAAKYESEWKEIHDLKGTYPDHTFTVSQITFLGRYFRRRSSRPKDLRSSDILGTIVIVSIFDKDVYKPVLSFINEAIISLPSLGIGEHAHLLCADSRARSKFQGRIRVYDHHYNTGPAISIVVGGKDFKISAAYFCQSNGQTNCCAHSALKMALWQTELFATQLSTTTINKLAKRVIAKRGRAAPDRPKYTSRTGDTADLFDPAAGLFVEEIKGICEGLGARTLMLDCFENPETSPHDFATLMIESAIPTLIVFNLSNNETASPIDHVMTVIGYAVNLDKWFPLALDFFDEMQPRVHHSVYQDYISSAEWCSHLIAHDDLVGPYLCLAPHTQTSELPVGTEPYGRVSYVIGIVRRDAPARETPYHAQVIGSRYFHTLWKRIYEEGLTSICGPWRGRLLNNPFSARNLVLRTQMISCERYLRLLQKEKDHIGHPAKLSQRVVRRLVRRLPDYAWLIEFSRPGLFSGNRGKLGEILLEPKLPSQNLVEQDRGPCPLLFRFLGHLDLFQEGQFDIELRSHTKLYRRGQDEVQW